MANTTFCHIFLKAAEAFCWFIGTVAGMFALVLALTLFASTSSTQSSPSSAPTASSTFHHGTCDEDELHRLIPTYVGYVVCAMAITTLLMVFVRKVAGGAAKDHERVAAWEDAAYKAAYDAAEVANEAVERAEKVVKELNDPRRVNLALGVPEHDQALDAARKKLEECVQEYRRATDKAERLEPKEGIARLPKRWRIAARSAFFSAVCAHYMGSGCAGFAFYCSLEIQTKCTTSFLTIFLFVLAGVVSTTIHGLLLWVSSAQN